MLKVLVVCVVIVIVVDCGDRSKGCIGEEENSKCVPTYRCFSEEENLSGKYITASLCGYDTHLKQPLVCCQSSSNTTQSFVHTILVTPQLIHLTSLLNEKITLTAIIKLPMTLSSIEDLQFFTSKQVVMKFKATNISRYKRATDVELYTSNPLPDKESNVIPNPAPLASSATDPPLELFTSPPIAGEANVVPAVVPLQSQSDKPDTSSIMNLFTSAPLPPRANVNGPTSETPATASTKPVKFEPTPAPAPPKRSKKPVSSNTIDVRPIVFEDSLPSTTAQSDQIYFPDKVPGSAQNEIDSKINALSAVATQSRHMEPLERILPNRHTCGIQKKTTRFFDSSVSGIDEFPWVALLRYADDSNYDAGFRCAGSLISERYVITAAHCLTINSICVDSVRLGEWKVSSMYDCFSNHGKTECSDPVMNIKVERKLLHHKFDPNSRNNDIGLLRLAKTVAFTDYVRPICLPIKNLRKPPIGTMFTTSGWGTTPFGYQLDIKSKINFPVIHNDYCKEYKYFKEQTCIGYSKRHDFGKMDPGGPVMALDHADKPQWYLEGVTTRGYGCNLLSYPGAYTRITYYIDWLVETVLSDAKS